MFFNVIGIETATWCLPNRFFALINIIFVQVNKKWKYINSISFGIIHKPPVSEISRMMWLPWLPLCKLIVMLPITCFSYIYIYLIYSNFDYLGKIGQVFFKM